MVQTECGMAGKESKLFFNFFSTGGKHGELLRKTGDLKRRKPFGNLPLKPQIVSSSLER